MQSSLTLLLDMSVLADIFRQLVEPRIPHLSTHRQLIHSSQGIRDGENVTWDCQFSFIDNIMSTRFDEHTVNR